MDNFDQDTAAPKKESSSAPAKEEKTSVFSKVVDIIAFPAAALTGYWTAHTSIRNDAQEIAKAPDLFLHDLFDKYQKKRVEYDRKREANLITKEEWQELDKTTRDEYRYLLDTKMEEHGLGSFMSKWNYITRTERQKALIEGMGVSMIVVGALFSISGNKLMENLFGHSKKDKERE